DPALHLHRSRFFRFNLLICLALWGSPPHSVLSRPAQVQGSAGFAASAEDSCQSGLESFRRKDLSTAEMLLKQCVGRTPPQIAPYLALCSLYQSQSRTKDLYDVALKGLEKFPWEKRFYLTVGIHAGEEQRYEQAIEVFSEGFRRWPDDAVLKKNLA